MAWQAIVFDLDGTLLDTLEDLGDAVNRVLIQLGCKPHPLDTYRYFVGAGADNLITRALPVEKRNENHIRAALEAFRADYAQNWNIKTKVYEGVSEMLDFLVRRGLKIAVLSNKPHYFTQQCVAELLPRWAFAAILGQRKAVPRKPDPAGALEIAAMVDILPDDFLYLGDSGIDMQTAKTAGMYPVGALWGFRTRQELQENGAQALIEHPLEIMDLFD